MPKFGYASSTSTQKTGAAKTHSQAKLISPVAPKKPDAAVLLKKKDEGLPTFEKLAMN